MIIGKLKEGLGVRSFVIALLIYKIGRVSVCALAKAYDKESIVIQYTNLYNLKMLHVGGQ
jgi:hypothetical protein